MLLYFIFKLLIKMCKLYNILNDTTNQQEISIIIKIKLIYY
jgi:hypothetical protein